MEGNTHSRDLLRKIKDQSVVDRAINDICILLQCSRHNLNVAHTIPVFVEEVKDIVSVAQYILVVEKESGKRLSRCAYKKVKE
ncbi:hypothetical protein COLO4_09815 [Corchorus olitorius]|uniref:Spo11/DNA topoisomerase VI subunit A N-terminal domain-containing protein n=1 Tax=Corchorus olitorius TaxID=93759 RepID=A0A1R3KB26_9ROSI|nr:hypothetical protein COLO4_09815 [Corchorus olitorius]